MAAILLSVAVPGAHAAEDEAWAQRVQVLYDGETRSVRRVLLKVRDPEPGRNLEFVWEPHRDAGFDPVSTGGVVEGRGKLVWRVRGSSPHDRRAVYMSYEGEMKDGRPHGRGRLDRRDGEVSDGEWVAGVLHGDGMHLDASGNRYRGPFADGRPHGSGRQEMADGSIYEGAFAHGLRHGEGRLRLPGGTVYASYWQEGVQTGPTPPEAMADSVVGGLLRAQGGGGDAGKVDLSVIVEPRMTQRAPLRYTHAVGEERIDIYPDNPDMVGVWTGDAPIVPYGYNEVFGEIDWDDAPAFVQVSLETADRSRVRIDRLELQVEDSQIHRKPFLSVVPHEGCVGYRPSFSFQNNGWGPVRDATLSFEFYNQDDPSLASRGFELPLGGFDEGTDAALAFALDELGVDTATLAEARFTCGSVDEIPMCRREVLGSLRLGEVAPLLSGSLDLSLGVRGRLAYRWADDSGASHDEDERFEASVHIGFIETELMVAEGGDGWQSAPEALRYQEVRLPSDARNYTVEMPVRGNASLATYTARLKMFSGQSSTHSFRVSARFADGSERYSKPVALFYLKPRETYYDPPGPASCYIDAGYFGGGR